MSEIIAESENEQKIHDAVISKTIESVEVLDDMDSFLVFHFTDKTKLMIRYDYVYEWKLLG
jgi:hypothetical protein